MANKKSIQILRGTTANIVASDETLLPGQPLYNTDKNYLTIGSTDGDVLTKKPIAAMELVGYVNDRGTSVTTDLNRAFRIGEEVHEVGPSITTYHLNINSNMNVSIIAPRVNFTTANSTNVFPYMYATPDTFRVNANRVELWANSNVTIGTNILGDTYISGHSLRLSGASSIMELGYDSNSQSSYLNVRTNEISVNANNNIALRAFYVTETASYVSGSISIEKDTSGSSMGSAVNIYSTDGINLTGNGGLTARFSNVGNIDINQTVDVNVNAISDIRLNSGNTTYINSNVNVIIRANTCGITSVGSYVSVSNANNGESIRMWSPAYINIAGGLGVNIVGTASTNTTMIGAVRISNVGQLLVNVGNTIRLASQSGTQFIIGNNTVTVPANVTGNVVVANATGYVNQNIIEYFSTSSGTSTAAIPLTSNTYTYGMAAKATTGKTGYPSIFIQRWGRVVTVGGIFYVDYNGIARDEHYNIITMPEGWRPSIDSKGDIVFDGGYPGRLTAYSNGHIEFSIATYGQTYNGAYTEFNITYIAADGVAV